MSRTKVLNDHEIAFLEDWKALIKKYDVEVSKESESVGYYNDHYFYVWGYAKYDENGDIIQPCIDIKLDDYL